MNAAATNVTEGYVKVQFPGLLGFSCWIGNWLFIAAKVDDRAIIAFWQMTFMALWTCMKCIASKYDFQMHHLLNLWKKVVPIRSRDVPNAICLFHTRPQESCVVILRVCPVRPWNRCGFSLAAFISRLSVKNNLCIGHSGSKFEKFKLYVNQ